MTSWARKVFDIPALAGEVMIPIRGRLNLNRRADLLLRKPKIQQPQLLSRRLANRLLVRPFLF